jgi:hypothetical protein
VPVENEKDREEAARKLKSGQGVKIKQWLARGVAVIPTLGEAKEAAESLFLGEKGAISGPVKIKDKTYLFLIEKKEPRTEMSFEQVKDQVEKEYSELNQREIIDTLFDKVLEQQEVEIYPDEAKEAPKK